MNPYCMKECKHRSYCKLDDKQTQECKVDAPADGLIMGRTFDEIIKLQQGNKL